MKFSLFVNQYQAIELGIKNIQEAVIFDLLTTASTWANPEIVDNQVYYWVSRTKIVEMLPILNLKADSVYRYLKHLNEIGLVEYKKDKKKDLIIITKKGKKYLEKYSQNTMSEKNPNNTQNSEKNPKKLGKFSENTMSEKNPTDYININYTIRDNNEKQKTTTSTKQVIEDYLNLLEKYKPNSKDSVRRVKVENEIISALRKIDGNRLLELVEKMLNSNNNFLKGKAFNIKYIADNFLELEMQLEETTEDLGWM